MHDQLTSAAIQHGLATQVIGRVAECYAQLGSTNELMRRRARAGAHEGLVIIADEQTAGRGRMGRGWAAPPGTSLLMSVLLRPAWLAPADVFALTMLAGVALCEAVEQIAPVRAALKWPNDLLVPTPGADAPRKAAGVLSEVELSDGVIAWVVIGMGININWAPAGIVDGRDLGTQATSIAAAAGRPVDRLGLAQALLARLDARYAELRQGHHAALFAAWRARLATLGQPVQVSLPAGVLSGLAEDVEPSGALRIRDAGGNLHRVMAGDVSA